MACSIWPSSTYTVKGRTLLSTINNTISKLLSYADFILKLVFYFIKPYYYSKDHACFTYLHKSLIRKKLFQIEFQGASVSYLGYCTYCGKYVTSASSRYRKEERASVAKIKIIKPVQLLSSTASTNANPVTATSKHNL